MTVVRKDYFDSGAQFREDYHREFNAAPFVSQTTRYLWYGWPILFFSYEASELTAVFFSFFFPAGEAAQNLWPNFSRLCGR